MDLGHRFTSLAYQLFRMVSGMGLFFELVIALFGGGFVANRVRLFFVDGFFFHGSRSGERGSRLVPVGTGWQVFGDWIDPVFTFITGLFRGLLLVHLVF